MAAAVKGLQRKAVFADFQIVQPETGRFTIQLNILHPFKAVFFIKLFVGKDIVINTNNVVSGFPAEIDIADRHIAYHRLAIQHRRSGIDHYIVKQFD